MSSTEIRRIDAFVAERWRNGGGTTRTIATLGACRVSLADVAHDGPYSRFEGTERVSFVVRGDGVRLRDGESETTLAPHTATRFSGDAAWQAELIGQPVTVLNVIAPVGRYRITVNEITAPQYISPGALAVVLTLDSACMVARVVDSKPARLGPGDVLTRDAAGDVLYLAPLARGVDATLRPAVLVMIEPLANPSND